jgi:hypothetical protein
MVTMRSSNSSVELGSYKSDRVTGKYVVVLVILRLRFSPPMMERYFLSPMMCYDVCYHMAGHRDPVSRRNISNML